jgi:hypothetical protein
LEMISKPKFQNTIQVYISNFSMFFKNSYKNTWSQFVVEWLSFHYLKKKTFIQVKYFTCTRPVPEMRASSGWPEIFFLAQ